MFVQNESESFFNERKLTGIGCQGQVLVESILIMVVLLGLSMSLFSGLRKMDFASSLVSKPWESLSGMIECGSWEKCGIGTGVKEVHPNTTSHLLSLDPEGRK